jgi:hypothetical protein
VGALAGDQSGEALADLIAELREAKPGSPKPRTGAGPSAPEVDLPVHEWLTDGTPSAKVLWKRASYRPEVAAGKGRHTSMTRVQMALVRYGSRGEAGIAQVMGESWPTCSPPTWPARRTGTRRGSLPRP